MTEIAVITGKPKKLNKNYPLPSGARSWMVRWAHNAGTGGSKIRPFGNWANATLSAEQKQANAMNVFISTILYGSRKKTPTN